MVKKSRLWLNKPKHGRKSQNSPQYKICPKPPPAKMHHSSSPGSSKNHSCTPQKSITPKRIRTLSPMKHSPASFSANDNTTSSNPEDDDTTIVNEKTTTCTQIYNGTGLQEKMIQDSYFVRNRLARTIRFLLHIYHIIVRVDLQSRYDMIDV
ncbi:unnamed protein product [Mytilus edulis]|uniref:Uncharacterized protein n=1 Tax=Mytilus edulis TaxID=6550 RepID=A0A8S3T2C2_MYTED|nr:unnamed protein product [Mytilus edulis]